MKKWLKSFVHNCLVHPIMQFMPCDMATDFHDRNANWAFDLNQYNEIKLESGKKIRKRRGY